MTCVWSLGMGDTLEGMRDRAQVPLGRALTATGAGTFVSAVLLLLGYLAGLG